jgi:hypothetical protein
MNCVGGMKKARGEYKICRDVTEIKRLENFKEKTINKINKCKIQQNQPNKANY